MPAEPPVSWPRRIAWFVGLYVTGIAVLGLVAYGLRLWLRP